MRTIANWDKKEAWGNGGSSNLLPPGYFPCQILKAEDGENPWNRDDRMITFYFDIIDGEYKGYFNKDRNAQQGPEKVWRGKLEQTYTTENGEKYFKGLITAIEESNPGYVFNFDETTLKGKVVGIGFRKEWYEDRTTHQDKFVVRAFTFRDIHKIADLDPPTDKPKKNAVNAQGYTSPNLTPPGYQTPGPAPAYNHYDSTAQSAPKFEELGDDEELPF